MEASEMEFIKDITIIIDRTHGDWNKLEDILPHYHCEKTGSCYRVKGTFKELEDLVDKLLSVKRRPSPATQGPAHQQNQHASAHVTPLEVSALVMEYIQNVRAEKLKKIQGDSFVIETQPSLQALHSEAQSVVQVTIRAQSWPAHTPNRVQMDFVRQRFITFYQRTASDLQVTSLSLGSQNHADLQRRFPLLLFKPSHNKNATVIGPFAHLDQLQGFLSENSRSLSRSQVGKVPTGSASSNSPAAALKHSKRCEEESCPICMEPIKADEKKTLRCKHSFCKDCLKHAFRYKPVCPMCGELYGVLRGNQPDGGTMTVSKIRSSLPGYEKHGTIIINYYIPNGIQKEEHPNPGQPFEGVSRSAYLPDSPEGRRILDLLRRAFDQRLTFTIGRSSTSGRNNMVTWNDIHHKTSTHGGPTGYGYPDPDYLNRVQAELKVKGID